MQPEYSARTDVGRVREINEDRVFAGQLPLSSDQPGAAARHLLVVADGVGGFERGEWASEQAVTVVAAELPLQLAVHEPREALQRAFEAANQLIWQRQRSEAESRLGPAATTVVAVIIDGGHLWWANVGDSRAYVVGQDRMQRLTRDHSWVEEQVRNGSLTPDQARISERRNVITRGVGFQPAVDVDTGGPVELRPSDVVVLCSDGLHGLLADEDIASVVRKYPTAEATERLVGLSNERGGTDNISVIVCGFVDRPAVTAWADTIDDEVSRQGGNAP
ncbi:MAG TPA: protein phosphatase 2C domain-containing protein [Chloroflexota bacterium]|nr:protein phosphatase 2C domain-containing protein [Chloroflexota bacterium]